MMLLFASALETVERVPLFAGLDKSVVERLAACSRLLHLRDRQEVARRGRPQTHLFVVQSGKLEISIHGRDGKRHMVRHLLPGEVFGLIPVLDGQPAVHDAAAHGDTEVLQLPSEVVVSELRTQPELALRALQLMCNRSRQLFDLLAFSQLLSLDARIGQLILLLSGIEPQAASIAARNVEILMTQADMSDMLGVSRQSLNSALKKLERQQLIRLAHARLKILDVPRLERFVGNV